MFQVLETLFGNSELEAFKVGYEKAKKIAHAGERTKVFKSVAMKFVEGAAKVAGAGVVAVVKAHLPLP